MEAEPLFRGPGGQRADKHDARSAHVAVHMALHVALHAGINALVRAPDSTPMCVCEDLDGPFEGGIGRLGYR